MERADLETYQVQLSQVDLALQADPDNTELASLRSELQELISLTQTALAQAEAAASSSKAESSRKASSSTPVATWSAGDDCLARYSADGAWYPARITTVGGSSENRVYTIVFKGYNTTEQAKSSDLKPLPPNYNSVTPSNKRKLSKQEEEERERKKKKNEKKLEARAAKAKEQNQKQATWQKFAKKSEKKGVHIAGVAGTSIFKTPDNPLGKVGVTGSGKGMTEVATRGTRSQCTLHVWVPPIHSSRELVNFGPLLNIHTERMPLFLSDTGCPWPSLSSFEEIMIYSRSPNMIKPYFASVLVTVY